MAGPAYYDGTMNIAKNEDWIVPFIYGSYAADGVTVVPIDLTNSTLKMEIRIMETDNTALVSVFSPDNGIVINDAAGGAFTIVIDRSKLARLVAGTYFADLVRLMSNGYQERLIDAQATVVEGTTR
jgi:hypothetical protein